MLTKAGAKLMDFGLAKPNALAAVSQSGTPGISSMATLAVTVASMASPVTVAGSLIGTVQYMSRRDVACYVFAASTHDSKKRRADFAIRSRRPVIYCSIVSAKRATES
jgi:hypothetical protein